MRRSHPPALATLARRALMEDCGVRRGERVLLAVSGGPDSMALLHVLAREAPRLGVELRAHGVDHGLRVGARAELDLAAALAARLGVRWAESRVQVAIGANLQARARDARWRALDAAALAAGCALVATGHHADDRAETLLLRVLRGAPLEALAVLPPRDGARIRPLWRARRADIVTHVARHRLEFAEDPSNDDARFLRVRVRREVLPLLEQLDPRIVEHLNALADTLGAHAAAAPHDPLERAPLKRSQRDLVARALARAAREGPTSLARVAFPLSGEQEIGFEPGSARPVVRPARAPVSRWSPGARARRPA
ncbi:MAG: tRNA lysidine(34) synthetase TilS [Polyangiaceae bacterium]|nr:tRNA lysidine(34) synthetase TilS [Polyangiaceae bacterium]